MAIEWILLCWLIPSLLSPLSASVLAWFVAFDFVDLHLNDPLGLLAELLVLLVPAGPVIKLLLCRHLLRS